MADLIAGVIAGREKKKSEWLVVRNNLNSFTLNSEVDVMRVIDLEAVIVIELSYEHLPHHLKPCLLYLAHFPKDTTMETDELKKYWHAEGLVEQTEMMSVEEVMWVYLDNLISSSLVILFNERGNHPTCQLHDLVHYFCFIKARKEKLLEWISSSDCCLQHCWISSSDFLPHIVNIVHDTENLELNNFVLFSSKKKHLYSLLITGDEMDDQLYDVYHLRDLRLLRVLQLFPSFIMLKNSLLNEKCMLNHLMYLFFGTEVKSLPSSFSNLWNLEILHVNNEGSTFVLLPRIWDLVKLRELSVTACSFFDKDTDEPILIAEDSKLENLRALEQLVLSYSKDTEDIFRRFPNLQVLKFSLKESWDYSTQKYWFPKLDFLSELEFLNVGFESSNTNDSGPSVATNCSWDFHFPSNLKKFVLRDFPLTSNSLSTIANLPNLEELILMRTIMQGGEWNMGEEDTFENLKYLGLCEVTLAKWKFGEESFPTLRTRKEGHEKLLWKVQSWEEGIMEKRGGSEQLIAATSAKTTRDTLHIAYANKYQTRIFSLRDRLMRLTKESQPVTEYLQTIWSIFDELSTTGAPISNSELIVKILSGLGLEFHEISTAIRARDSTITYEELYKKLLEHELFLRHEE
ncbi:hypothetical protein BC332_28701 [Capsicum chinense]|nr:hypothetical protein BC332_28701 [Capsicum chinense]